MFNIDLFQLDSEVVEIVGVGGVEEVLVQTVESVEIGAVVLNSFIAQFGDVTGDFGSGGILGADIFSPLGAVIDYNAESIEFVKS